jgi:GxxExxY protein
VNHQGTKTQRGPIPEQVDHVATTVVDAAFDVHLHGPGLLESVYQMCLAHAIKKRGGLAERQVALPV